MHLTRPTPSLQRVTCCSLKPALAVRNASTNRHNSTPIDRQSRSPDQHSHQSQVSGSRQRDGSLQRDHHKSTLVSQRRTTFRPTSALETDGYAEDPIDDDPSSFLQQKAKSVMNKRAEAASLTSMTNAEKAAFDNIWKLFEPAATTPTPPKEKHVDQKDTDFKNLLELFESFSRSDGYQQASSTPESSSRVEPEPSRASAKRTISDTRQLGAESLDHASEDDIDALKSTESSETGQQRSPEADRVDTTAHVLVEDVSSSFDAAIQSTISDPELAMWEVCEAKVFPLTKLLIPTRSKLTSNGPPPPKEKSQQATPKHPLIAPDVPLIPLLSKVYPATLLLALRLYKRHYPTSPYCTALLPHIKSLGPTSYVLGANTHFYNTLISIRWDFYSDLDEIVQLLAEMDRMGLEYDTGTASLLKRISLERDSDLRHERYENNNNNNNNNNAIAASQHEHNTSMPRERGAQWWQMPLVERSWNRLQAWRAVVTRNLEARGLGEVMREGSLTNLSDAADMSTRWASRPNAMETHL